MNNYEDQQVYDVKYSAKPFRLLSDSEISIMADSLLIKIYAITGWQLPTDEHIEAELAKQFSYTLKEAYGNYNHLEVEFAFRKYSPGIEDWGKYFNLNLLSKVMEPYILHRIEVSKDEEHKNKPKMILSNQLISYQEKEQDIAEWEQKKDIDLHFIPTYIYDYLIELEKINPSTKDKFAAMSRATEIKKEQAYNESFYGKENDYKKFMEQYENGFFKDETEKIKILAKKILVFDYLNSLK